MTITRKTKLLALLTTIALVVISIPIIVLSSSAANGWVHVDVSGIVGCCDTQ